MENGQYALNSMTGITHWEFISESGQAMKITLGSQIPPQYQDFYYVNTNPVDVIKENISDDTWLSNQGSAAAFEQVVNHAQQNTGDK